MKRKEFIEKIDEIEAKFSDAHLRVDNWEALHLLVCPALGLGVNSKCRMEFHYLFKPQPYEGCIWFGTYQARSNIELRTLALLNFKEHCLYNETYREF